MTNETVIADLGIRNSIVDQVVTDNLNQVLVRLSPKQRKNLIFVQDGVA